MLGIERADPRRDLRAPVAALRAVARVAEPVHQLGERARDARTGPSRACASAPRSRSRAATARHVERVGGVAAVRLRVGQPRDDVEELDDRTGPAVREEQRTARPRAASGRGRSGSTGRRSSVRKCASSLSRASCARQSYVVAPVRRPARAGSRAGSRTPSPCPSIWSGSGSAPSRSRRSSRTASSTWIWNGSITRCSGRVPGRVESQSSCARRRGSACRSRARAARRSVPRR